VHSGEEVTLERQGNSYFVPVSVNGLPPMGFLLDTGADAVARRISGKSRLDIDFWARIARMSGIWDRCKYAR